MIEIDLEIARQIYNREINKLLSDPILAPFKDQLLKVHHEAPSPVRIRTFKESKRTARTGICEWIANHIPAGRHISSVYDLAGPQAMDVPQLWRDDLKRAKLFHCQNTHLTLIDTNAEYLKGLEGSARHLKRVVHGNFWEVMPLMLRGKGSRGHSLICVDLCGTLYGNAESPDLRKALPELMASVTARYESLFVYLTVAMRGEAGEIGLRDDLDSLKQKLEVNNWTCKDHQVQAYTDTHPMMSAVYYLKRAI